MVKELQPGGGLMCGGGIMGTIMGRPGCSLAPRGAEVEAMAVEEGSGTPFLEAGAERGSGARSGEASLVSMETGTLVKEFSTEWEEYKMIQGLVLLCEALRRFKAKEKTGALY